MPIIRLVTDINAPIATCFDMARDIGLHPQTVRGSQERAIAGRVRGLLGPGEWVTFEAKHFGVWQRLTARMTAFEAPILFADEMTQGAFKSLTHRHEFSPRLDGGTRMTDTLEFISPLGVLGRLADRLFLERHMRRFLEGRNRELKRLAETGAGEEQ